MTTTLLKGLFDSEEAEFLKFENVEHKKSLRPDLHAFLLLDELVPGQKDMISAASHDEFFLDVDIENLAASPITTEQVLDLIRCGVRFDSSTDSLAMFT